jgi:ABC-type nitrate/sulfonate/bicarbonate transport system substrate-binding protein
MNKNLKWPVALGVVALVAAAGIYFASKPGPQESPRQSRPATNALATPVTVKWGGPKNISMLPLTAENQGLFTKHQLVATYVDIQTGKKAMDALRTGDIDLGVLVDSNLAFAGYEQADDLRVLACIMTKRDDALLVAKDGFEKPSDLAGQTIGVTLGTTTHAYLVQWLEANGMKPSAVNLQNMPPPAIQAALLNGSLKAGCLWQPFRFNVLAAKPDGFTELKDSKVYTSYVLLVCTKRYLDAPGASATIANFIKALVEAEAHVAQNQESSQGVIAEKLGIPTAVMKTIWPEYDLRVFLNNDVLALLGREGKWISESVAEYMNKAVPDYHSFLHPQILQSVDAGRVQGL